MVNETFKINVYFDEEGEEIEKIIFEFILSSIERRKNA